MIGTGPHCVQKRSCTCVNPFRFLRGGHLLQPPVGCPADGSSRLTRPSCVAGVSAVAGRRAAVRARRGWRRAHGRSGAQQQRRRAGRAQVRRGTKTSATGEQEGGACKQDVCRCSVRVVDHPWRRVVSRNWISKKSRSGHTHTGLSASQIWMPPKLFKEVDESSLACLQWAGLVCSLSVS